MQIGDPVYMFNQNGYLSAQDVNPKCARCVWLCANGRGRWGGGGGTHIVGPRHRLRTPQATVNWGRMYQAVYVRVHYK